MSSDITYAPVAVGSGKQQEPHAPQPLVHNPYDEQKGEGLDPQSLSQQYHYSSERDLARTPSPTPSEAEALMDTKMFNWKQTFSLKRENWVRLAIISTLLVILIAFAILHDAIIKGLQPEATWVHDCKGGGGFAIAIAILIVLSFPPLFGAEFIAILCGVVWGVGIGFAVVITGQFLGELATFFTFKYMCQGRSEKLKQSSIKYAALGRVIEDGGVKVAVIMRYSIIPTHATTALFATCGMKLWVFVVSAILSMPKQFVNVFVGASLEQTEKGEGSAMSTYLNVAVVIITTIVTVVAVRYIDKQINLVKPQVVHDRRKARQFAASAATLAGSSYPPSTSEIKPTTTSDSV
ncbi:hypothetical protein FIBSPDRAFT_933877 [Athelia psychrophila]|uniref:Golgi apparatus membrane protein TVP38 n=1 Tax=Athelia psychrophila TaxID=1759441 RepID=A0A166GBI7_9AGAM|nr:hypothetical protein FIBSPDRAFT_1046674 [Fibularhizoctonia sp. CBS 109695]KZP17667.1 hypothetical protein FIBSPDRAFT_933877 [Fibularhizoctonia sp. CBS 109695]